MSLDLPFTVCLREDGFAEIEELLGYSLREPEDGVGGDSGGEGEWCYPKRLYGGPWKQSWDVHQAAVRLGRKGGIASGISRRR